MYRLSFILALFVSVSLVGSQVQAESLFSEKENEKEIKSLAKENEKALVTLKPFVGVSGENQNSGLVTPLEQSPSSDETTIIRESKNTDWNVNAYPNPADDILFIQSSEEITKIALRDIFGKEILTKEIHDRNTSITLSSYASGYYILYVTSRAGIKSMDIVKQ